MPNHTTNVLTVDGSAYEIARFIEENKNDKQDLTFEASLPTPPELLGGENQPTEDGGWKVPDWYEWRITNWGTKWDCYDVENWEGNSIRYYTAWSPATNYFLEVSLRYPNLTFTHAYADEGAGFVGSQSISEGKVTDGNDLDWDSHVGIALREELGVYYPEDENE
jgi:hypothetical protein